MMKKDDIIQMIELSKFTWEDGEQYARPIQLTFIDSEKGIAISAYKNNYYLSENGIYVFLKEKGNGDRAHISFYSYDTITSAYIDNVASLPNVQGNHQGELFTRHVAQLQDKWKEFIDKHNKK